MSAIQQLLTEHLDIWTAADTGPKSGRGRSSANAGKVYGISKLRELILELAVRGKLVPQDASDEPASELLKRIQAEKAKPLTKGKIKKDEIPAAVTEEEKPFEIPHGWEWVRLGQATEVLDSLRRPVTRQDREPGPYPYYGASGVVDYVSNYIFDEPLVLVGEDGAKWGRGENTAFLISGKTWVNNHAHVIRPYRTALTDSFLVCTLNAMDLGPFITGMTVPKLNQAKLISIVLPLPPITEQHRIVAKVDELMALCDQLESEHNNATEAHEKLVSHLLGTLTQSQSAEDFSANWQRIAAHFDTLFTTEASIDALKQTLLQLAVMGRLVSQDSSEESAGELLKRIRAEKESLIAGGRLKKGMPLTPIPEEDKPFILPLSWEWVRFEHVAKNEKNALKAGPFGSALKKDMYVESGYKIYGQEQVIAGDEDFGDYYINEEKYRDLESCKVQEGDILISLVGTIGKVLIISERAKPGIINPRLVKLSLIEDICREYVKIVLGSQLIQDELFSRSHGSTMNVLNLGLLKDLVFPLPPVGEQHRIVAKVDELIDLCEQLKSRFIEVSQLRQALADVLVEKAAV